MTPECPHDVSFGMPSVEALEIAANAIRRRYVLPDTMQHPQVRSECIRLAYLIQAYGLATTLSVGGDIVSRYYRQRHPAR